MVKLYATKPLLKMAGGGYAYPTFPLDPLLRIALWSVEVRKHISLHKRWRRDDFTEHVDEPREKLCEIIDYVLEFSTLFVLIVTTTFIRRK